MANQRNYVSKPTPEFENLVNPLQGELPYQVTREPAPSGPLKAEEPYTTETGNQHLRNYFFSQNKAWNPKENPLSNPPKLTPEQLAAQDFFQAKTRREKNIVGKGRKTRRRKNRKIKK